MATYKNSNRTITSSTGDPISTPEDIANSFLVIADYYFPMDGVNEKGLCVANLEVNEGGQKLVDTGKNNYCCDGNQAVLR